MDNFIKNADIVLDKAVAEFAVNLSKAAEQYADDVAHRSLYEMDTEFYRLRDEAFNNAKSCPDREKMMFFLGCATGVDATAGALKKWLGENGE